MRNPNIPEIHTTDTCMADYFQASLGNLASKLTALCNDYDKSRYDDIHKIRDDEKPLANPSDIELTTVIDTIDMNEHPEAAIIVRSWHETSGDNPGIFHQNDMVTHMMIHAEDAYLAEEHGRYYQLSARESLVINNLEHHAAIHATVGQRQQE